MALKAGTVLDFSGSLTAAMELAMAQQWQLAKGVALPGAGADERRLLFAAIAQGLFVYLKANEKFLMTRITLKEDTSLGTDELFLVTQLELNL